MLVENLPAWIGKDRVQNERGFLDHENATGRK